MVARIWKFESLRYKFRSRDPPECVRWLMHELRVYDDEADTKVDLRAILERPEWQQVPSRSTQHMRWPAEVRLRMTSWYTFHVTFPDNADEALPAGVYDRRSGAWNEWGRRLSLEKTLGPRSRVTASHLGPTGARKSMLPMMTRFLNADWAVRVGCRALVAV